MSTSKKVWKFPVRQGDAQAIALPLGANIVHFGSDPAAVGFAMWAEVDPAAEQADRSFMLVGTGWDVPSGCRHLGTTIVGPFVWHLYEVLA